MPSTDTLIIGGGINGLACALALAKAGARPLVVEADDRPGGAARTVEFCPGYRVSHVAHLLHQLDSRLNGAVNVPMVEVDTVALDPAGDNIVLAGPFGKSLSGRLPEGEAKAWELLRAKLLRHGAMLGRFRETLPPRLGSGAGARDYLTLGKLGLGLRALGRDDMREFLRLILINVADVLDEELTDDRLKGLLAFDAVLGTHLGPRSPNSLMSLWYRLSGTNAGRQGALTLPKGGMGAVSDALANATATAGATIRPNSRVASILVADDRVKGIVLESGEELHASTVICANAPGPALLKLLGPAHLDIETVRRLKNLRARGNVAKLHIALARPPLFKGLEPGQLGARLVISPSVDAVERAFNAAKYHNISEEPVMEIVVPSAHDPSLAPAGGHVLSANVQYAPYELEGGWEAGRAVLVERCLDSLERYAPGLRNEVRGTELLTPADIESRYRMPGGHWHHCELSVDQLFFLRPVPGLSQYATPIAGLWLASAGTHPGGGVSGTPGLNAAAEIVRSQGAR